MCLISTGPFLSNQLPEHEDTNRPRGYETAETEEIRSKMLTMTICKVWLESMQFEFFDLHTSEDAYESFFIHKYPTFFHFNATNRLYNYPSLQVINAIALDHNKPVLTNQPSQW